MGPTILEREARIQAPSLKQIPRLSITTTHMVIGQEDTLDTIIPIHTHTPITLEREVLIQVPFLRQILTLIITTTLMVTGQEDTLGTTILTHMLGMGVSKVGEKVYC